MINRLVPACIGLSFCAKPKKSPGEVSRVKKSDEMPKDSLVKSPKVDTFTSSPQKSDVSPSLISEHLPQNENSKISNSFIKKGNA